MDCSPDKYSAGEPVNSNDLRPNSGLREGDISHAEVNDFLRVLPKTIIFGQQNRLRPDGLLLDDEKLPRFHSGHDLVKFFYSGVRQLPEYIVDALLAGGISITLVKSTDLLVYYHPRKHQSFHTGRTRKTIYIPEMLLLEAYDKGYDYWAISEVIIEESWPLLDYLLILDLVRRSQSHLRVRFTLGRGFVLETLRQANKHLMENEDNTENEFNLFFGQYQNKFLAMGREILEKEATELVDEIFDEEKERTWASNKLYTVVQSFNYPTFYNIDRDIVHPAAMRIATNRGVPTEPQTVEDYLHDLGDAARFETGVQIKTDAIIDKLIAIGAPGIRGYASLGWSMEVFYGAGYYPTLEFKRKLQAFSASPPDGIPGSISHDFERLLHLEEFEELHRRYLDFDQLPFRRKRLILLKLLDASGTADRRQLTFEIDNTLSYANDDTAILRGLADIFYEYYLNVDRQEPDWESYFLGRTLVKLDRHPEYHETILPQYMSLSDHQIPVLSDDQGARVTALMALIPEDPLRQSFDPQRLRARLHLFEQAHATDPNDAELVPLLVGILLRLDRCENYDQIAATVGALGEVTRPICLELAEQIGEKDLQRQRIRQTALRLLASSEPSEKSNDAVAGAEGAMNSPLLIQSFYQVMGKEAAAFDFGDGPVFGRDQPMISTMKDEGFTRERIAAALTAEEAEIPHEHRAVLRVLFCGGYNT